MNESAIKRRLERELGTRITWAEWVDLKEQHFIRDYQMGIDTWPALCGGVEEALNRLRRHIERTHREQAGELDVETEPEREEEPPNKIPPAPATLSDRARARDQALSSLNLLRSGGRSAGKAAIHGALFPRGGVDGTLAQWVYVVAVELWVPAEEVANSIRRMQMTMLAESSPPKTSERAFEVAAFVWDNWRVEGKRPPWPVLCERWNNWPLTEPFKKWQSFQKAYSRGAKATQPRYVASNEQITSQVRSGGQSILDVWAAKIRD
jgi:hypothetical protein